MKVNLERRHERLAEDCKVELKKESPKIEDGIDDFLLLSFRHTEDILENTLEVEDAIGEGISRGGKGSKGFLMKKRHRFPNNMFFMFFFFFKGVGPFCLWEGLKSF